MHLTFSASTIPANDNTLYCEGCTTRPANPSRLCDGCDAELCAHLDAVEFFHVDDAEGELLAAGVSVDDGARFAAVEVVADDDAAGVACATCNDAREFYGEPSRHNPSGVHDCPDCG